MVHLPAFLVPSRQKNSIMAVRVLHITIMIQRTMVVIFVPVKVWTLKAHPIAVVAIMSAGSPLVNG